MSSLRIAPVGQPVGQSLLMNTIRNRVSIHEISAAHFLNLFIFQGCMAIS